MNDRRKTRIRSDVKKGDIITFRLGWFVSLCKKYVKEGYLPLCVYLGDNTRSYKIALKDWTITSSFGFSHNYS